MNYVLVLLPLPVRRLLFSHHHDRRAYVRRISSLILISFTVEEGF